MWGKQVFATFTAGVVTRFQSQSAFPAEEPCHRPKQQKPVEFQLPKLEVWAPGAGRVSFL